MIRDVPVVPVKCLTTFECPDEFCETPQLLLIWSEFCGRKEYASVLYLAVRQGRHAVIRQSAIARAWA
jgi:hypothetical protein